jgi:HAD superfamily hydrolase (TIGR01549 family)
MNIKGVFIDFGGTLAYVNPDTYSRYENMLVATLKKHGHSPWLEEVDSSLGKLYKRDTSGEFKNLREYWTTFLKDAGIAVEQKLVRDLDVVRKRVWTEAFTLYDNVLPTLSSLQAKYRLALVSNCSMGMRDVINALNLTKFFGNIVLSYEVGVRKPSARIYLAALEAGSLKAHECIFVADEISDLEGARNVGMSTVLVRQGSSTFREARDPGFEPDFECNRISEITQLL